ncbi:MAG: TetM/TetW/TetO/TetS family tetracycline resistance ribosomal protection protein [Clostridium sp.]
MDNLRNVGIFAHVDGGKTTTTEQMLYISGKIRNLGSVDKGDSVTDYNELERRRGVTIFADEASFQWNNININLIDTPGHIDFYSETERSFYAIDGAILIVSAFEGIQGTTEVLWNNLTKQHIPTIIFLNKIDRVGVNLNSSLKDIEDNLTENFLKIDVDTFTENNTESLVELLSKNNEDLLDRYLSDDTISCEELKNEFIYQCNLCKVFPLFIGSSLEGKGITDILNGIVDFIPSPKNSFKNINMINNILNQYIKEISICEYKKYSIDLDKTLNDTALKDTALNLNIPESNENFKNISLVYKIKFDKNNEKLAYVKVLKGSIVPRQSFLLGELYNKISSIRRYLGEKYTSEEYLSQGNIGVVCGLKDANIGDIIGLPGKLNITENNSGFLSSRITLENIQQYSELIKTLNILAIEDPSLNPKYLNPSNEVTINLRGILHMEVLKDLFLSRFNMKIIFETPRVIFLETIENTSRGFCHYEPKKHFSEVELEISPLTSGSGIQYSSKCSVDYLPSQFQNIIEKTIDDSLNHGVLLGSKVVDININLISGRHDLEHTHGGDFRIATIRAMQQALENNHCTILEPLYSFKIVAPNEYLGKIISDILKMKGTFLEPLMIKDKVEITGELPIQNSMNYPMEFLSMTSGKGLIALDFSRYNLCHNIEEVLLNPENRVNKDESLYNSISLFIENGKMKKVY